MKIKVLIVHPTVTKIQAGGATYEIPTAWFPDKPEVDQEWELDLTAVKNQADQYRRLNQFLRRD